MSSNWQEWQVTKDWKVYYSKLLAESVNAYIIVHTACSDDALVLPGGDTLASRCVECNCRVPDEVRAAIRKELHERDQDGGAAA